MKYVEANVQVLVTVQAIRSVSDDADLSLVENQLKEETFRAVHQVITEADHPYLKDDCYGKEFAVQVTPLYPEALVEMSYQTEWG